MNTDIKTYDDFQFSGHKWPLLADSRGTFASFNRACHLLGLRFDIEWARVQRYPEIAAFTRIEYDVTGEPIHYVQAEAVPTWLLIIPPAEVPASTRRLRAEITRGLVTAIYSFVTKGVAVREGTPLVSVLKEVGEYAMSLDPSERTRLIVSGAIQSELMRLTGRNGETERPVTVAYRVQERGLKLKQAEVNAIGQAVAKEYRKRTGKEPFTFPQMIDGAMRPVKSYTAADVPLLDRVIDEFLKRNR